MEEVLKKQLEEPQEKEMKTQEEEELEELEQLLYSTAGCLMTKSASFTGLQPSAEHGDTMNNRSSGPSVC